MGQRLQQPCYIDLDQARKVLADMGIALNPRQMKRAADKGQVRDLLGILVAWAGFERVGSRPTAAS
jgi:hypothetical protein